MTTKYSGPAVCQSCAALMRVPEDRGTDAEGRRIDTFCRRCYVEGRFVEPDLTRDEMVRRVADEMRLGGLSEYSASREIASAIAGLARWRGAASEIPEMENVPTQKAARLVVSRKTKRR